MWAYSFQGPSLPFIAEKDHGQKITQGSLSVMVVVHNTGPLLKAETWRQEIKQKPWRRNKACWLAPCGLLSLLSYTSQDHLATDGTAHNEDPLS